MSATKSYICIDLKSFYASVECVERGLDPMNTNLVVADPDRTDKTICLAITPAMKKLGIKNRCRVFEIPHGVDYIMAEPRMQKYIEYSANIYGLYLNYVSKDDIHVYSIDEVFIDVTNYLRLYDKTAKEFASMIIGDIKKKYGIQATAGIGTNLYLAKIAMDIIAKHEDNFIGCLDEWIYRQTLWEHRPLRDFWRIGPATEKTLSKIGIYTMGDIARTDEEILYKKFGVDAELLIDHAFGREPVTIADIKKYKPSSRSISSGQVLSRDYSFEEAKVIIKEMIYQICLDMEREKIKTKSISIYIGYSRHSGAIPARGTAGLIEMSNSYEEIIGEVMKVYNRINSSGFPIRKINISCNAILSVEDDRQIKINFNEKSERKKKNSQKIVIDIKDKFGLNSVFKAIDLKEEATALERNGQIGGHKSGKKNGYKIV